MRIHAWQDGAPLFFHSNLRGVRGRRGKARIEWRGVRENGFCRGHLRHTYKNQRILPRGLPASEPRSRGLCALVPLNLT